MNIEKEIRRIAASLLKRPPTRRGPFEISDDELKHILKLGYEKSAAEANK